jgi:hypothetical protein
MASEAYTSGLGWTLSHFGPGSLLAGVWFVAALARIWPVAVGDGGWLGWIHVAIASHIVVLAYSGLGLVRVPVPSLPTDSYRYVAEIEREFEGVPADEVLLDLGTWVYLKDGVVMKDRAPSFGDRGYVGTGDYSEVISRLEQRRYGKILVRNLHSHDFWYDHYMWARSSGFRGSLLANYREVRTIRAVSGWTGGRSAPYWLSEIAVLVPRDGDAKRPR